MTPYKLQKSAILLTNYEPLYFQTQMHLFKINNLQLSINLIPTMGLDDEVTTKVQLLFGKPPILDIETT